MSNHQMLEGKNIKKQNPFKVPPGYFEKLPSRIEARINTMHHVPVKEPGPLWLNPWIVAAASVVLIIGLAILFSIQYRDPASAYPDTLAQEELNNISEYILMDIDESELIEAYMDMTDESQNGNLTGTYDIPEQDVFDYLLQDDLIEYYLLDII